MPGQQELLEHMNLQHTEATAEGNLLFGADALVAEHHYVMIQVGAVDAGEVLVVDWPGQVEADDLGTYSPIQGADFESLCGNGGGTG
nr:hypothetical protein FFPRI1PSEUD_03520 [Pseudomonas sp. FFPRI_1]